jgi:hypothetical protein
MDTTLGETTPAVTDQLGADALACSTGDAEVAAIAVVWDTGLAVVTSLRVNAYVPVLARTAATRAMALAVASRRVLAERLCLARGAVGETEVGSGVGEVTGG